MNRKQRNKLIGALLHKQKHRCIYCNIIMTKPTSSVQEHDNYTIEHIIPQSVLKLNFKEQKELNNLALACFSCNTHKRALPAKEFITSMYGKLN